jgi:hypothetical protein
MGVDGIRMNLPACSVLKSPLETESPRWLIFTYAVWIGRSVESSREG